jgi:hypothetical protein
MASSGHIDKIGFVGTFEVANYGDCLFPLVYMELLKEHGVEANFSFHSPRAGVSGLADYGPVQPLPARLKANAFDAQALILCGGETLGLGHSGGLYNFPANTLSAFARMWLAPVVAAAADELGFYVHCVGMPTSDLDARPAIARALAHANWVTVRDEVTADRLGGRFAVKVDPVFTVSSLAEKAEWDRRAQAVLPPGFVPGNYLCAHISSPYVAGRLAQWCDQTAQIARQRNLRVLLLPVCHFLDDHATLEIARDILISRGLSPESVQFPGDGHMHVLTTAALIGSSGGIVTSSLHAMVTAVSFGVPFACYPGAGKKNGKHAQTLRAVGLSDGIALRMDDIASAFDATWPLDRMASRQHAVAIAREHFAELVAALRSPAKASGPLPAELVEEIFAIDRRITRQPVTEAKRFTLRALQRWSFTRQLLQKRRRARLT